jgi:hypothetical protein
MQKNFPERKEFRVLYETILLATSSKPVTYQDLSQIQGELMFRTFYDPTDLAEYYSNKYKLENVIERKTIHTALVKNKLIEKNADGNYMPTELGKIYAAVKWYKNDDKLKTVVQWRQEVLLLLGKLH